MKIKIVEVKLDAPLPAAGSRTNGFMGRFTAGNMIGWAVLVPYLGENERLAPGSSIPVETMYDSVEGWSASDSVGPSTLTPLPTPGDYLVDGTIVIVGSNTAAIVEAAGFAFDITSDELPKPRPVSETRVKFTLKGLSLWDEGDEA